MPDGDFRVDLSEAIDPRIRVIARRSPLVLDRVEIMAPPGLTLAELVALAYGDTMDPVLRSHGSARIGYHEVPSNLWHLVKPKPGVTVDFILVPQGNVGRILIGIAIVVAAAFAAPYLAGAILPVTAAAVAAGTATAAAAATLSATTALITAGIAFAGNLLLNALIPLRPPSLQTRQASQTYSISGGQNSSAPWGAIPVILGRHRMAPLYAARSYTEASGNDQWLRQLYVFGYGPLRIEDIRIGNTLLADFDDVQMEVREGLPGDAPITLYPGQVLEQAFSHEMPAGDDWVVERTDPDADEISIDWTYPKGLVKFSEKGKPKVTSSVIEVEYRLVGNIDWVHFGTFDVEEKKQDPFRVGKVWSVPKGQYDVRLRCTNDDSETQSQVWTALRTIRHEVPFTFAKPLALLALRIKAQGQLNGVISNLTAICTSRCKDWNGSTWVDNVETSNPASIFRYVLQHPANALPRLDSQIDLATLQEWHLDCFNKGIEFNMVRDAQASVQETLTDIATVGRANPARPNGRWSVIRDRQQSVAADHFTPRNSWDFQVERSFRDIPEAWRCRFVDRQYEWKQDERIIYREGVTPALATNFESIEFRGITDAGKVWTEGQRRFRELQARADTYSFSTAWESLRINRGDLILVQSDVTRWGLAAGRVKAINGSLVDLDDFTEMDGTSSYVIRFRRSDGSTLVRTVESLAGRHTSVTLTGAGASPSVGDLWMFGLVNFETHRLVVQAVEPGEDHAAKVTALDEAMPFIDEADDIDVPVWVPRTPYPDATVPAVPVIIGVSSGNSQQVVGDDGTVYSPVSVGVAAGQGGPVPTASFQVQHRYQGTTVWRTENLAGGVNSIALQGYVFEDVVEVRARALSRDGIASAWTSPPVVHVVLARTTPPPPVVSFTYVQLSSKTRQYHWVLSDPESDGAPPDLLGYRIRYKLGADQPWADLTPLHTGTLSSSPLETTIPQVAGLYTFGIVSVNSTLIESTPYLVNITLPGGVAPNPPIITTPSQVTSDNTPTIAGTADPTTNVHVFANSVDQGTAPVVLGAWSLTLPTMPDATYSIEAFAYDGAGQPSDPSAPITVTVDTVTPAAPVISNSSPMSTTDTTPTISGTGETGCSLQVFRAGSTPAAAPVTVTAGAWSVDLSALVIGSYAITAKQTDAASHTSAASSTLTLNIIPVAPAITTSSATIGNTNPVVAGTSTASASVGVYVDGVLNQTVSADGSGNWSATLAGLAGGARSITARQTISGQTSAASAAITLTVVWYDPDASIHADFKGGNYRLNGVSSTLTGIFDIITTSPQIVTNADGSLHPIAANTAPVCDRGLELWENRTNRATNRNANPTDLTGVTLSGDAAATLTRVDDSANMGGGSILADLLSTTTINGFVFKLDNSAGVADAFATIGGTVAVTGACRGSIVYRGSAGRIEIGGATAVSFAASTPYVRVGGSRTAAATSEQMRVAAPAGAVIFFVLNQLENGAFDTAPIVVNAGTAARSAPLIQHTAGVDFSATEGYFGARARVATGVTNSGVVLGSLQTTLNDANVIQFTTVTAMRGLTQVAGTATGLASQAVTATNTTTGVYGFKANDFGFAANGLATVTDVSGALPTGTPAKITVSLSVTPPLNGVVEQVKWGTTKPSTAVIQAKSGWTTLS